jgi:FKBP-type peptidyl-prolyl cis-trans isomerase
MISIFKTIKTKLFKLSMLFIVLLVISCTENKNTVEEQEVIDIEEFKEPLISTNKEIVRLEDADIDFMIKRYSWEMEKSPTGLRYIIENKGDSYRPQTKDEVEISFYTKNMYGDFLYSSEEDGNKVFRVNKTNEIGGLHEAVQMLGEGGKAKLIIPSYLAYGMVGDGDLIRERTILIMDIEIIRITKSNN